MTTNLRRHVVKVLVETKVFCFFPYHTYFNPTFHILYVGIVKMYGIINNELMLVNSRNYFSSSSEFIFMIMF